VLLTSSVEASSEVDDDFRQELILEVLLVIEGAKAAEEARRVVRTVNCMF
jgi:hypothetical protein